MRLAWFSMISLQAILSGCSEFVETYDLLGEQKKKDQENMRKGAVLQWLHAAQSCTVNGSINTQPGYIFSECIAASISSGLIFDSASTTWISGPAIVGNNGLECHSSQSTGPETVCGTWWYMYSGTNPPPGAAVSAVFRHACTFDASYHVTGVNSFSGYTAGNTYFCVPGGSAYGKYQMLVPQ